MSRVLKWPSMYNKDKWGTRNTKGTSSTISCVGKELLKMLGKLPPLKVLSDSLVSEQKCPGYRNHVKTGPFYGPYLFNNGYCIVQGKFVEEGTLNDYGWRIMIREDSFEYCEMNEAQYIGFRREVYPRVAIDSDYSKEKSKKTKFWFLDEHNRLQSYSYDYTKGDEKPPGYFQAGNGKQKNEKDNSDDDDDDDTGMGGMFD